ncbi:MAG: RHS repeat-associated core domain-containing protein [Pyrinomonadaceae bacterium]
MKSFNLIRFTSYERDANGGDDAMMRKYQSSSSRFNQPDPYDGSYNLTDPQSLNRYAYVQNDPVNFVDPSGLNIENPSGNSRPQPLSGLGLFSPGIHTGEALQNVPWSTTWSLVNGQIVIQPFALWVNIGIPSFTTLTFVMGGGSSSSSGLIDIFGGDGGMQDSTALTIPTAAERMRTECFDGKRKEIDAAREKFRSEAGKRILTQAAIGAGRGAIAGGIGGAAGGGVFFGVGAIPGAVLGVVVGATFGAAAGVISGGLVYEPARRFLYNSLDYEGAVEQPRKYCDAQF